MGNFISFAEWGINNLDENFLNKYWDWDKNELNPYEISYGSDKKVWIKCQDKDYHNSYLVACNHFKSGRRCPYCSKTSGKCHPLDSFAQYHIDNTDSNFLEKYWDYERNTVNPYEISPSGNSEVWIRCQEKSYHGSYKVTRNHFTDRNSRCPYCHNKVHYFDSLGFLYHNIAKMIVEDERNGITWEDTYKIAPNNNDYFYFKCLKCNRYNNKKKKLSNIQNFGHFCEFCSDGVSIPEKFMMNLLNQLNVDFITQYSSNWSNNKRYDFYIPGLSIIIETHGRQHYEGVLYGKNLKEEQENDEYKKELALKNGIEKYIVIDCRESTLNWLKENIIKELNNIFNLNNINWENVWEESQNSLCAQVWELWNEGLDRRSIADKIGINKATVTRYLKKGKECNICDYTEDESRKRTWANTSDEEKNKISEKISTSLKGKCKGINGNTSKLYKIIDLNGNETIMCGNQIYNSNKQIGFLNITKGTFDKYIKPYNNIDILRIEENFRTRKTIEKLKPFNGWAIIQIND